MNLPKSNRHDHSWAWFQVMAGKARHCTNIFWHAPKSLHRSWDVLHSCVFITSGKIIVPQYMNYEGVLFPEINLDAGCLMHTVRWHRHLCSSYTLVKNNFKSDQHSRATGTWCIPAFIDQWSCQGRTAYRYIQMRFFRREPPASQATTAYGP